ncbi:MAG: fibronectin type III domain-containing protein [Caldisericia bacterium]|nr:fibronectin type III domain-containing protein [Caldisericia bacterium]
MKRIHAIEFCSALCVSCLFLSFLSFSVVSAVDLPPESPSNLEAIPMYDQINLLWQDNSKNENGFIVERKKGIQDFDEIARLKSNCGFYLDINLKEKTTYYYRVKSFNKIGTSSSSNEAEATTDNRPSANEPPEAPSRLLGRTTNPTQIELSWQDNSNNESGFQIARRTSGTPYQIKGDVFTDTTRFIDNLVEPNTTYYYKVRAINTYGNSNYSEEIKILTKSSKDNGTTVKPASPSNLEAILEDQFILLTWNDASNNEDSFRIYMAIDDPNIFAAYKDLPANSTRYEESELLIPGHTFYFHITAVNKFGESNPSNDTSVLIKDKDIVVSPKNPSNLKAIEIYSNDIVLRWEDNSNDEEGFKIERRSMRDGKFSIIQSTPSNMTTYRDTDLDSGMTYYYRVYAFNSGGSSFPSNTLEVKTRKQLDEDPPEKPDDKIIIKLQIGSKIITINGRKETMDVSPMVQFERTVLPIRHVVEGLGGTLTYEVHTKVITIVLDKIFIEMQLKNPIATVNGKKKQFDPLDNRVMPISIPPGRTMIPVRFVAENLGCKVEWEPHTKSILITKE